ncbi:BREX system ATP-binding protein BrxD [Nocardia sp. NPDC057663]|uniref:BREX system ATP-binding protein BrxD n=1 Tax=Nocardia sp. NPDC057663 TaxID=3346201 RepID=UPI003671623B
MSQVSHRRRREILDALRLGTVPSNGLDQLAVGLERFDAGVAADLDSLAHGGSVFKAVRGEFGAGKTFFARWIGDRALKLGYAVAEVQVNEVDTPLYKLDAVYRRATESLRTASVPPSALRRILDAWLYAVQDEADERGVGVDALIDQRLAAVSDKAPIFPLAIRAYRRMAEADDQMAADGLVAWLGGQPSVAASIKRQANIRGDLTNELAPSFFRGLLAVLKDAGHPGMLLILDEVETVQRMRADTRMKALNTLRQFIDDVHKGEYPGLYLMVTGTPALFEGRQGVQLLQPLAERLHTDFSGNPQFDNVRAPQLRLTAFDLDKLVELGLRVKELYAVGAADADRIRSVASDEFIKQLATSVAGALGAKVGIAPRLFLRKLVDVLDKIDQYDTFDPYRDYEIRITESELGEAEKAAISAADVPLEL